MSKEASESPDILQTKPQRGKGVRRLNRVPMMLVGGVLAIIFVVIAFTMYQKSHPNHGGSDASEDTANMAAASPNDSILATAPKDGIIAAAEPPTPPPATPPASVPTDATATTSVPSDQSQQHSREWDAYYQAKMQAEQQRQQEALAALHAATAVQLRNAPAGGAAPVQAPPAGSPDTAAKLAAALAAANGKGGTADPNGQAAKNAFLNSKPEPTDYLPHKRNAPVSPFEVKAGTVIPAVMVGGINSDLPGQIIAQVSENVYDTATGRHLLIPQGAKLVGTYSSSVTYGQKRVLVAWRRIIYPDASSLDLGMMPGADQAGYAGFNDKVNNHYFRTFGSALLMSLFSAGIQLSQPQAVNGQNYNNQQIIAGAIGQQVGELGMEMASKNLNIQPTLKIRPGYQFNVMVTKDMVLTPWQGSAR